MTRLLLLLSLLPSCGLVRAVDQQARDAGQDAEIANNVVGIGEAKKAVTGNTTAILDIRDRLAETPEEHEEIARLRAENADHIGKLTAKLKTAEAVAAEKAQQAKHAEAAIQEADENAWWRTALEIAFAALGVGGVGGLALRWRGLLGGAITALVANGEAAKNKVGNDDPIRRAELKSDFLENNSVVPAIQKLVLKALGKDKK